MATRYISNPQKMVCANEKAEVSTAVCLYRCLKCDNQKQKKQSGTHKLVLDAANKAHDTIMLNTHTNRIFYNSVLGGPF